MRRLEGAAAGIRTASGAAGLALAAFDVPPQAVPSEELRKRLAAVQQGLREHSMAAGIFVQNVDLFYLTGSIQQGHLLVPAAGEPVYLVRRDVDRAREESNLDRVEALSSLRELPAAIAREGVDPEGRLAFELDVMPVNLFRRYQALFPTADLVDCSGIVRAARAVKSPYELETLRRCGQMAELIVREAAAFITEGMREIEVSAHLEAVARRSGHQGLIRFRAFGQEMVLVHVFAGASSAVGSGMDAPLGGLGLTPAVAQGAGRGVIEAHQPIVVDFGGALDGYVVDQTRVLSLGELPADLVRAHQACLRIQEAVVARARPGAICGELYAAALAEADALGYSAHFMGAHPNQVAFVGHGVGLEIDEPPFLAAGAAQPLKEGNVFALEPKLVFPGRGSVGVENTWRVTSSGLERLTFECDEVWML